MTNSVKDVAQTGKDAAGAVATTATDAAKDVAEQTKQQATDLFAQTKSQVGEQVVTQKSALVDSLRSLGDQLAAMTDHIEESGTAVDLAGKARDQARSAADWLDGHEPEQVLDEVRKLGREQPGRFLLGAVLAGVAAGRLTRGAVAVHTDDSHADTDTPAEVTITDVAPTRPGPSPVAAGPGKHGFDPTRA